MSVRRVRRDRVVSVDGSDGERGWERSWPFGRVIGAGAVCLARAAAAVAGGDDDNNSLRGRPVDDRTEGVVR